MYGHRTASYYRSGLLDIESGFALPWTASVGLVDDVRRALHTDRNGDGYCGHYHCTDLAMVTLIVSFWNYA